MIDTITLSGCTQLLLSLQQQGEVVESSSTNLFLKFVSDCWQSLAKVIAMQEGLSKAKEDPGWMVLAEIGVSCGLYYFHAGPFGTHEDRTVDLAFRCCWSSCCNALGVACGGTKQHRSASTIDNQVCQGPCKRIADSLALDGWDCSSLGSDTCLCSLPYCSISSASKAETTFRRDCAMMVVASFPVPTRLVA